MVIVRGDNMQINQPFPVSAPLTITDTAPNNMTTPCDNQSIAISIVSNSRLFRDGVITLLCSHLEFDIAGSYAGDITTYDYIPNPQGHIVLLDTNIGRTSALTWLDYWQQQHPRARVIVMELVNAPERIVEYIERGALGYTLQNAAISDVADVVRQTRKGTASCSPEMTSYLFTLLAKRHAGAARLLEPALLTRREREVLQYLVMHMSNREIAERLVIEVRTVKHHVHNILAKLKLSHRWDIASYAHTHSWLLGESYQADNT
jgi:DNA-binding NarL/FixJ family response regulator